MSGIPKRLPRPTDECCISQASSCQHHTKNSSQLVAAVSGSIQTTELAPDMKSTDLAWQQLARKSQLPNQTPRLNPTDDDVKFDTPETRTREILKAPINPKASNREGTTP